jgi:dTDP-4-dehydrorhamnose 3,5-epimerase
MSNIGCVKLDEPKIISPQIFKDHRGWFYEAFSTSDFIKDLIFVQDNHSYSTYRGTIRGLHLQKPPFEQAKLVRVIKGRILDFVVDLRSNSENYLKIYSFELDSVNKKSLYIPRGFAHGFITLEDHTEVYYKIDQKYSKEHEITIKFDDSTLKIDWPRFNDYVLSEKDRLGIDLIKALKVLEREK